MHITRTVSVNRKTMRRAAAYAAAALAAAALAIAAAFLLFVAGMRLLFFDRALPGVRAGGLSVDGLRQAEIELALGQQLTYPQRGVLVLEDGDRRWLASPHELGVAIDAPKMAHEALSVGRRGGPLLAIDQQLQAWYDGFRLPPQVVFDQRIGRAYLEGVAQQIDRPTVEAQLRVEGQQVIAEPGQIGRRLNRAATLEALTSAVSQLHDARIRLVVEEAPPTVLDASQDARRANAFLSEPLILTTNEGESALEIPPADLAQWLRFEPVASEEGDGFYRLYLDAGALRPQLEPLVEELQRDPRNARFIFNDDTRELDLHEPAVIGRDLDIEASIEAINQAVDEGAHSASLVFDTTDPEVTSDVTAEALGITENVVTRSTYFSGSSAARIQNIRTAAEAFHGLLVAPGETLSMADILGDITLDKGYAEALIIYGDRTIKGVGGGVCQVSTTLFRTAFFGGYELVERHPHAYRVLYYEQGPSSPGPGLDATVFVPLVDFKFTNDTENWLLLETYIYNNNQLQWKFYSTSDGRSVDWTTSGAMNEVEAPEPLYKENPELEEGEIDQVDFEADGMDVVVTRTVTRDGEVLHDDVFRTHYLPWQAIYEYGPGTDLPEDAKTE